MDTKTQSYLLGIDAGGTSIRLLLADADGRRIVEEITTAASDGGTEPLRALILNLLQSTKVDSTDIKAVCAGITKISRAGVLEGWQRDLHAFFPQAVIQVVPDFVIAFHGATGGVGVAVIAGTGSVVYAQDGQGHTKRVGGRGWEYGDEGSGAWLTTEVVRRTVRSLDGLEEPTVLTRAVALYLGTDAEDPARFVEKARRKAGSEGRGFLVPLLLNLAQQGNNEARNLFVGAGGWLAAQTRAAVRQLNFPVEIPLPVAMVGGLWEAGDFLCLPFQKTLTRWVPQAQFIVPRASPVEGAVALALTMHTTHRKI